jgi:hypothetical protein
MVSRRWGAEGRGLHGMGNKRGKRHYGWERGEKIFPSGKEKGKRHRSKWTVRDDIAMAEGSSLQ